MFWTNSRKPEVMARSGLQDWALLSGIRFNAGLHPTGFTCGVTRAASRVATSVQFQRGFGPRNGGGYGLRDPALH